MGELLNNILKYCFIGIWFVAFAGGFYVSAAIVSADVQKSLWRSHYRHAQTVEQANKYKFALQIPAYKSVLFFAGHPKKMLDRIKRTWPLLDHPSDAIGKGNIGPNIPDRILFYHVMPPPVIFLIIAGLMQGLAYPVARSKLARSLAETDKKIFGKIKDLPQGDGFVIAEKIQLSDSAGGNPHVLTIAPSGGGKSASQVMPSLLKLPDDCCCVVTDPKGELLARSSSWLKTRGHKIYVLGPLEGYGDGWDPLCECRDPDEVRELARQVLSAGEQGSGSGRIDNWIKMSRTCLAAYLLQAWTDKKGLADGLQNLFEDQASGKRITDDEAKLDYAMFESMASSGATVGSILATVQGAAAPWLMSKVAGWMQCERQFHIDDIRKDKAVVFLVTSAADMKATQAIQWVFFSMLFSRLAEGGDGRVRFLLDEFANLGALEGVDHALNLLRSAGVSLHAFVQNLSQMNAVYGRDTGAVVSESFGTVCVMAGLRKDADELGKLLGLKDDIRANYSTQDEKMRAMFGQNQLQALEGSALRQIKKDEVLIISGNHKPIMAKLRPWYRIKVLKHRVPELFWPDWKAIPETVKEKIFMKFGKVEPRKIVLNLPPKKKRGGGKAKAISPVDRSAPHSEQGGDLDALIQESEVGLATGEAQSADEIQEEML